MLPQTSYTTTLGCSKGKDAHTVSRVFNTLVRVLVLLLPFIILSCSVTMADLIKKAPLAPILTGSILYLLTRAPPSTREPALLHLRQVLSDHNISRALTVLTGLFGFSIVRYINSYLNELANNNYYITSQTSKWVWNKENAVVTGASSGFGTLFSRDLAAKGIHVAALDINDPPADFESNPKITFFKCDVTAHGRVAEVAKEIQATIGHPSILINNAGIAKNHSMLDSSPEWLRKIFDVNLISHYYFIQAFLPHMIEQKKGHIITVASSASFVSCPGMVDYCITKAGVLALHQGLGSELRAMHKCPEVNLSIVHPSWADTGPL